jgi:hypothetical protein
MDENLIFFSPTGSPPSHRWPQLQVLGLQSIDDTAAQHMSANSSARSSRTSLLRDLMFGKSSVNIFLAFSILVMA